MRPSAKLSRRDFLAARLRRPPPTDSGDLAVIADSCLARRHIHCQSCGDVCPEAAIRFRPRLGGPPLPDVRPESCTGCGDCLPVCPTGAISIPGSENSHV